MQRGALPAQAVPVLHSNRSATAKLYLSLNGRDVPSWGSRSASTPPFDYAGDMATVTDIWQRVSDDYAQFNIDVTTEDPGNENNRVTAVISIGGSWSDWYGSSSGGVAYVGGFYNLSSNVGFVFSRNLGNNPKYIADAASHEAGHLFGLQHQSLWQDGALIAQYRTDGPIMGSPYSVPVPFWTVGPTSAGPSAMQDDIAIIAGPYSGFGFKPVSATKFKCLLPTSGYAGELTVEIAGQRTVVPTEIGQTEVTNLSGNQGDLVLGEFVYLGSGGKRSPVPSTASLVL